MRKRRIDLAGSTRRVEETSDAATERNSVTRKTVTDTPPPRQVGGENVAHSPRFLAALDRIDEEWDERIRAHCVEPRLPQASSPQECAKQRRAIRDVRRAGAPMHMAVRFAVKVTRAASAIRHVRHVARRAARAFRARVQSGRAIATRDGPDPPSSGGARVARLLFPHATGLRSRGAVVVRPPSGCPRLEAWTDTPPMYMGHIACGGRS